MNSPAFLESRTNGPCGHFNGCSSLKRICVYITPLSSCLEKLEQFREKNNSDSLFYIDFDGLFVHNHTVYCWSTSQWSFVVALIEVVFVLLY